MLHILEYLDVENEETLSDYRAPEFYITPPVKPYLFTGDLIKMHEEEYVILTPACDMVKRPDGNRNADRVLLCKLNPLSDKVTGFENIKHNTGASNNDKKRLLSFLKNKGQRYFYLPVSNGLGGKLLDFEDLSSKNIESLEEKESAGTLIRMATISFPFLKDLTSRFGNYFSRQGAPDISVDALFQDLFPVEE